MKRFYSFVFLFFFTVSVSFAQYYTLNVGTHETRPCETDSTTSIDAYSNVRMYSTLDDTWNGALDSSLCYSLVQNGNSWRFPLSTVPNDRSVFFEFEIDSALPLDTSTVYLMWSLLYYGCSSSGCEKVHMKMQMPDSSGTDTVYSMVDLVFETGGEPIICFPTQKIIGQEVIQVVYEFHSYGATNDTYFQNPNLEPHYDGTQIIPQVTYPQVDWGPYLVRYWNDVYPTPDSISYTDVMPYGSPTDSTLIEFYIPEYASLHFQDFTALRGALVDSSNSVRHGLDVILNGNMCITWFEVFWEGGTHLVADGGTIGFHGSKGCNLFGRGGGLKVKSGTEFHYGHNGIGMMALKTDAQIEIEPGGHLVINGPVFMYEYGTDTEPNQLYMELPVGAKLTFGEGSSLSNQYSKDGTMKLNIYMRGGELDLSGLTDEEQQLINLIYDKPSPRAWENLTVYPNPTVNSTTLLWVAKDAGEAIQYELFDMTGKRVENGSYFTTNPGHNRFELDLESLKAGTYTIRLTSGDEVLSRTKIMKQ
ncbi:MAG: T9SS type A sorting domain-containing protein [Flavobacteriales bacterium]|nr:T9SS type A sorting domain-containing protein [Flavobacteriales bacterium]